MSGKHQLSVAVDRWRCQQSSFSFLWQVHSRTKNVALKPGELIDLSCNRSRNQRESIWEIEREEDYFQNPIKCLQQCHKQQQLAVNRRCSPLLTIQQMSKLFLTFNYVIEIPFFFSYFGFFFLLDYSCTIPVKHFVNKINGILLLALGFDHLFNGLQQQFEATSSIGQLVFLKIFYKVLVF